MIFTSFASKDNTISNVNIRNSSKTGSNCGASEILEMYVLTSSASGRGLSRILINFDISELSSSISRGEIPSSSVKFQLTLKSADHYETTPYSFDIEAYPVSRSWDEGRGISMYDEGLKDLGVSNWRNATSVASWASPGSDFISSISSSQHFETGFEDLSIDVSNIVYAWLTGGVQNNGILLKYSDAYETGSADFYVKKFYSRQSHVPSRKPKLDALWYQVNQDDRENVKYNLSGNLYYYRQIDGHFKNLDSEVFVHILNSSSTVVQTLTASRESEGVYKVSGVVVSPTSSTIYFRDVWFSGSTQYFTGSFLPVYATGSYSIDNLDIDLHLPNLKPSYDKNQKILLRVVAKQTDYRPAIRLSGTVGNGEIFLSSSYFSILNADTEDVLVDFSTGSVEYSKLSYDKDGNYFSVWTNSFPEQNIYKIKILVNYNGQKLIFDKNWKFKINE